jgi:hypothetical protein
MRAWKVLRIGEATALPMRQVWVAGGSRPGGRRRAWPSWSIPHECNCRLPGLDDHAVPHPECRSRFRHLYGRPQEILRPVGSRLSTCRSQSTLRSELRRGAKSAYHLPIGNWEPQQWLIDGSEQGRLQASSMNSGFERSVRRRPRPHSDTPGSRNQPQINIVNPYNSSNSVRCPQHPYGKAFQCQSVLNA